MPTNKADDFAAVKNVFANLLRPNMTLKSISEIVSPRLNEIIAMYEKRGLKYAAGKVYVKYVDAKQFQLSFEMYFKDDAGKWHKCAKENENNDATFLREDTWKDIKNLKVIAFPIEKTKKQEVVAAQQENSLLAYPNDAKTWQEFEVRLKKFFDDLPKDLEKKGIADYAVKIFSSVKDNVLCVSCKVYYDKNSPSIEQTALSKLEESTAPTWATKNLSAHELDVTAQYIKNLQVDTGILRLLDEYFTFYRCKEVLVSDDSFPLCEEVFAFLDKADKTPLTLFLPKIWLDWKKLVDCWRNFLVKMPLLMKVFGYDDYEDKIYSCIKNGNLRIAYKICYKRSGHWTTRIISSEFNNLDEVPTWATKDLTEKEIDVTERYQEIFSPRTLRNLNDIPSLNELFAYLRDAKDWREFESRLRDFLGLMPLALRKRGIVDYAPKLFSTVEKNFLGDNIVCLVCSLYYKKNGRWVEKSIIQQFKESDLPRWATKGLSEKETDVTELYKEYLLL